MTNKDSIRRNITQPPDWWAAFERAAADAGQTLSAWLGDLAKAKLPREVRDRLSDRPPAHRPRL